MTGRHTHAEKKERERCVSGVRCDWEAVIMRGRGLETNVPARYEAGGGAAVTLAGCGLTESSDQR